MAILGSLTIDNKQIIVVDADPTISGVSAETGSLILMADGSGMYFKNNTSNTNWAKSIDASTLASITATGTLTSGSTGTGFTIALGTSTVSGTLGATNGGTSFNTYTTGDIIYASATNVLSKRGIGTTGQVLSVVGGIPTWSTTVNGNTITTGTGTLTLSTFTLSVTATSSISNTNTGDETLSSIQTKLGTASTSTSGYLTSTDWNIFNNKQATLVSGTNIRPINGNSILGSTNLQVGTILGTIPATLGLIGYGSGVLDTLTSSSTFTYDLVNFISQPTTSIKHQIGTTSTNSSFHMDSVGIRLGTVATVGTTNTVKFEIESVSSLLPSTIITHGTSTFKYGDYNVAGASHIWLNQSTVNAINYAIKHNGTLFINDSGSINLLIGGSQRIFISTDDVFIANNSIGIALRFNALKANLTPNLYIGDSTTQTHSTLQIGGSFATAYQIKSVVYTLTITDRTIEVDTASATQTLPTAVGITGREYRIINTSIGIVRVTTTSAQTIGNKNTGNKTYIDLKPEEWLDVISNGTNWRTI
jgi:hypothetical protein